MAAVSPGDIWAAIWEDGVWNTDIWEGGGGGGPTPTADILRVVTQPVSADVDATMTTFTFEAYDSVEGARDTAKSGSVTIVPSSGTFTGTLTRAFSSGVATFNDIVGETAGGFTFDASSPGLTGVTTAAFSITDDTPGPTPDSSSSGIGSRIVAILYGRR